MSRFTLSHRLRRRHAGALALLGAATIAIACNQDDAGQRGITSPARPRATYVGSPSSRYGVNIAVQTLAASWGDSVLDQVVALNAPYVRIPAYWGTIQPGSSSDWDVTDLSTAVTKIVNHGLIPYIVVTGVPNWAASPYSTDNYNGTPSPAHLPDWRAFFGKLVSDPVLSNVKYWAVANEPNTSMVIVPVTGLTHLNMYDSLVRYAKDTIHGAGGYLVGPEVIGPSLADAEGKTGLDWLERAAYLADSGFVNYLSVHDYKEASADVESTMVQFNAKAHSHDIWLTEVATAYAHPPQWQQRVHLTEVLQRMVDASSSRSDQYWKKTFWWDMAREFQFSTSNYDFRGILSGADRSSSYPGTSGPIVLKDAYYCFEHFTLGITLEQRCWDTTIAPYANVP